MEQTNGTFMYHTNCIKCGSSDGVAVYDNETSHCFVCKHNEKKTDSTRHMVTNTRQAKVMSLPSDIEYKALDKRKISQSICRKYGYGYVTDTNGNKCQGATYYSDSGIPLAMKLRYPDKSFKFIGQPKEVSLFVNSFIMSGVRSLSSISIIGGILVYSLSMQDRNSAA